MRLKEEEEQPYIQKIYVNNLQYMIKNKLVIIAYFIVHYNKHSLQSFIQFLFYPMKKYKKKTQIQINPLISFLLFYRVFILCFVIVCFCFCLFLLTLVSTNCIVLASNIYIQSKKEKKIKAGQNKTYEEFFDVKKTKKNS